MVWSLLSLVAATAWAVLPPANYLYTSYATPSPPAAAAFCVKYFGAMQLSPSAFVTHRSEAASARVSGVRFAYNGGTNYHDIYFADDPTKHVPAGEMNATTFAEYLTKIHRFDIEETWDWWMDWHLCLLSDDVDVVLARLLRDKVPVVTRSSYSFYVMLPGGMTVQILGSKMRLAWSETFNFCRFTAFPPAVGPQNLSLASLPNPMPHLPELPPGHHSFFSTRPNEALNASLRLLGGTLYPMDNVWKESHRYSDGRCALIAWLQLPSWQMHFVQQYRKAEGERKVADVEAYFAKLHNETLDAPGATLTPDGFFDNRVGFRVTDLSPFVQQLHAEGWPHKVVNASSLFFALPGGVLVELLIGIV